MLATWEFNPTLRIKSEYTNFDLECNYGAMA